MRTVFKEVAASATRPTCKARVIDRRDDDYSATRAAAIREHERRLLPESDDVNRPKSHRIIEDIDMAKWNEFMETMETIAEALFLANYGYEAYIQVFGIGKVNRVKFLENCPGTPKRNDLNKVSKFNR